MTASAKNPARHRRHRILLALLIVALLILLLPLISLGRYHNTIAASLSRSLSHTVDIGSINLTLFPFPGLEIHNLTVDENPAFGAEPLLIAPTVTVYPRLSTLWTLRLEIGRIDLDNASVNLVRDSAGQWNFSSLLIQASRARAAPTAQRRPSSTLRFPYVDFSSARINFKQGFDKKPFSLFNTDASLWLADSNHWRIRLKAQPVRTDLDLDLEDTGTLRVDGSLTRAPTFEQLPLNLQVAWTGAQLGQVSRLLFGFDSGWRGDLRLEADITGDMANLKIHPRLHVISAHRLEFTPINQLNIDAFCEAMYHHPTRSLDHLVCLLPTGSGHLLLTGSVPDLNHPQPHLNLEINHTPTSFLIDLLGMLRRTLPTDLRASGILNGNFTWAPPAGPPHSNPPAGPNVFTGHAVASNVSIQLANVNQPFVFPSLTFATPNWTPPSTHKGSSSRHTRRQVPRVSPLKRGITMPPGNILLLLPANFSAGAPTPMQVSAQLSRSGFSLHFTGESSLARFQPATGDFAQLHPLHALAPQGAAETDLTLSGPWLLPITFESGPESQSRLTGFVRLQHAQLAPQWLREPIHIASATVQFNGRTTTRPGHPATPGTITWANATISVNGITAKGSASYPAYCGKPSGCATEVNLDFPSLDAAALQTTIFGPHPGAFLQSLLSQVESAPPSWPPIVGTIHAGAFTIGALRLTNARAAITLQSRKLDISSLDASTLGGSAHVTGSIKSSSSGPAYTLNLTWTGVKLTKAAALFHEKWGAGTIDGQSALDLHGFSSLAASASGTFSWVTNGPWYGIPSETPSASKPATKPGTAAPGTPSTGAATPTATPTATASGSAPARAAITRVRKLLPLRLPLMRLYPWSASGTISNQTLTFTKGPATGTISFARRLNLTWTPTALARHVATQPSFHLSGTIAHPLLSRPTAQAAHRFKPHNR
ncbi:MAG TPA: AsmA family protein [Acidobacteriaceae bacterium]|nr:AsmA family protein [Acidobacteriaceae bacterium]